MEKNKKIFVNLGEEKDVINLRGVIVEDGSIYRYFGEECICPKDFEEALNKCKHDNIRLNINSQGGSVYAGIEIHNLIKDSEKNIEVCVTGRAFSAATIIMMASEKRIMKESTQILIHKVSTFLYGNVDDFKKAIEDLERVDSNILDIYRPHFKGSDEELKELISDDRLMNTDEALKLGFITDIEKSSISKDKEVENEEDKTFYQNDNFNIDDIVDKVYERIKNDKPVEENNKKITEKENKNLLLKFRKDA